MRLSYHHERFEMATPFRITGYVFTHSDALVVEIEDGGYVGRGEALGIYYTGDDMDKMFADMAAIAPRIEAGISREELLTAMEPSGARNAIDCALWDLDCKKSGKTIWQLTGIEPNPVTTVFTIGIESTPEEMAEKAAKASAHPHLKIKLDGTQPIERMTAIRAARPDAKLVVDANQGWTFEELQKIAPAFAELNVSMIEQPLKRGGDAELEGYTAALPLAADESCLCLAELEQNAKRYQMINIKLDKCGGLTEGLMIAKAAREKGLGLMVGNMSGTSLSMAPSFVVAQLCDFVDIDGPLLLKHDRLPGLHYDGGTVPVFNPAVWG